MFEAVRDFVVVHKDGIIHERGYTLKEEMDSPEKEPDFEDVGFRELCVVFVVEQKHNTDTRECDARDCVDDEQTP